MMPVLYRQDTPKGFLIYSILASDYTKIKEFYYLIDAVTQMRWKRDRKRIVLEVQPRRVSDRGEDEKLSR